MGWLSWRPRESSSALPPNLPKSRGARADNSAASEDEAQAIVEAKIQRMFEALARKTRRRDMLKAAAATSAIPFSNNSGVVVDRGGEPCIMRDDALEALELILGLTDQPDNDVMRKLCPDSWTAERLSYEQFRDLIQVAGAWSALSETDAQIIERRWAAITDPEFNYTIDFPLKEKTGDLGDDGEQIGEGRAAKCDKKKMVASRMQRFRSEENDLKRQVYNMILQNDDQAAAAADSVSNAYQPGVLVSNRDCSSSAEEPRRDEQTVVDSTIEPNSSPSDDGGVLMTLSANGTVSVTRASNSLVHIPIDADGASSQATHYDKSSSNTSSTTSPPLDASLSLLSRNISNNMLKQEPHQEMTPAMKAWDLTKSLAAGGLAGAIAKTVIAPLDRTKIIFQTTNRKFTVAAVVNQMKSTVRTDGMTGLWRGHSATLARVMPYAGIQFVSFDICKGVLLKDGETSLTPGRRLLAGSMAGATSVICTYPLDLIRARMAVLNAAQGGMRHNFRAVLQADGPVGLYSGLTPTLVGILPYAGLAFGTFETLKIMVMNHEGTEAVSASQRFYCGVVAGILAQSFTYPLDIVRRRMQTDGLHQLNKQYAASVCGESVAFVKPKRQYISILSTMHHVVISEGVRGGLFKGLTMNWIKGPVAHGISFTAFDLLKKYFAVSTATR